MDLGPEELRARKRYAAGGDDMPLDPDGVLLGRELIDQQRYSSL